ncbi:peptidase T [Anaerococcus sp. AGMB09787]|uniref:peptidase T n=1 Tax=Anaerococcus sp. AGMB09787 TaxID=2922869 RepID=UPI001FB000AF|nr:peptidase T [Anaerococcus sp. AGMB09787]
MDIVERFLEYVKIDTQSDDKSETTPSTDKQFNLAKLLVKQLDEMGIKAEMDDKAYIYGEIPANTDKDIPTVGFIAHMDTALEVSGANVNPQIINYEGGDIKLTDRYSIKVDDNPDLKNLEGQKIITTDGSTLLGADDKAGIAIIMDMAEKISQSDIEHGPIKIGFTPDEEIGRGADFFDVNKFAADFAYTIDGGPIGELEYENFNAASVTIDIDGINVHPGSAKNMMVNSLLIATELANMLPPSQRPEHTEGYEGFYLLDELNGNVEHSHIELIIREFDKKEFENKKEFIKSIVDFLNKKYGNAIELKIEDSYYNMLEKLEDHMDIVKLAKKSMEDIGITPKVQPIRGGTDGARLSYMGLPCPNLFAGGYNFHSRLEFIPVNALYKGSDLLEKIIENLSK